MTAPFTFTKEDYLAENVSTTYPDDQLETYIKQSCYYIYSYAQRHSRDNWTYLFNNDKVTDFQLEGFKDAAIAQMIYWESNGGQIHYMSGFNEATNSIIPNAQLQEKELAPLARDIMIAHGLLNRGLI